MENIESLRNIAEYLGLKSIVSELEAIDLRAKQENASLIFLRKKKNCLSRIGVNRLTSNSSH